MATLTTPLQYHTGRPSQCNKARKKKALHIWQEEIKLSLFANYMIVYIEILKEFTKQTKKSTEQKISPWTNKSVLARSQETRSTS